MTPEPQDSPPPIAAPAPPPLPPQIEIEEVSQPKRKWTLEFHLEHIALRSEFDPRPWIYTRDEFFTKVELMEGMKILAVKVPRAVNLKLGRDGLAAFQKWVGPPTPEYFRAIVKRRYSWMLPIAAVLVVTSMPISGDAAKGVEALPFDAVGLSLGLLLGALWCWARFRPMPVIFVVDAAWFTVRQRAT